MDPKMPHSLGGVLQYLLDENGISGNALARHLNIAEGSVRNLLKYGIDEKASAPNPKTLTALASFFGVHPLVFFLLADYLPRGTTKTSAVGEWAARQIQRMPPDWQRQVIDYIRQVQQVPEVRSFGDAIDALRPRALKLQERRFKPDPFPLNYDEFLNETLTEQLSPDEVAALPDDEPPYTKNPPPRTTRYFYTETIVRNLNTAFKTSDRTFSSDEVEAVIDHPVARRMIDILRPNYDMNYDIKLYYLVVNTGTLDDLLEDPSAQQQDHVQKIRNLVCDIWQLLEEAAQA